MSNNRSNLLIVLGSKKVETFPWPTNSHRIFGIVRREKTVVLFYLGSYDGPFSASNVTVKNTMAILVSGKVYALPSSNRSAKDTIKRSVVDRIRSTGAAERRREEPPRHARLYLGCARAAGLGKLD